VLIRRVVTSVWQIRARRAEAAYHVAGAGVTAVRRQMRHGNKRWLDDRSFDESWDERSRLMARGIRPGSRVVDVGAGAQALRSALPPHCTYVPIDIVQRTPDTVVCDLNREDPPTLFADYIVASGLVEYVKDVPQLIRWIAGVAPNIVLSYEAADGETRYYRRRSGWVNSYTEKEIRQLLGRGGLDVVDSAVWRRQTVYWLVRT
jgi:hypothetical protein